MSLWNWKAFSLSALRQELITFMRFFGVSLLCGGLDLGVGLACLHLLGLHVQTSTAVGMAVGMVAGYLVHELWTFNTGRRLQWRTFMLFAANCLGLLLIRMACLTILARLVPDAGPWQIWMESGFMGIAFVVSLLCNYLLCRFWIFVRQSG